MPPETEENSIQREIDAKRKLWPSFVSLGCWKFISLKTGNIYDLSAADLEQIDKIESEGLFIK